MSPICRVSLLLLVAMLSLHCCHTATIPRTFDSRLNEDVILTPKKRPFCNAFTGCGRKRSQNIPGMPVQELFRQRQFENDDAVMPILDSESSSIDDLSRQIINAARLVEAIQDASAEIARRKQNDIFNQ
ncbi:cardioactive peptide-like [Melitaea cinxia]|uniref:cardioactive peptide-like n=1 Tax=Melitaea cinxia TaxID=113334 RepID=UPI001E2725D7|nr:cardioactive peptide-like [Melitaea cinxia]